MKAQRLLSIVFIILAFSCNKENLPENGIEINDDLQERFDWRDEQIVTPAKDQGSYGTCGVFSAMGVIEARIARDSGKHVDLSEQYYVNVSDSWKPSTGVNPWTVFSFVKQTGTVFENRLPYQAKKTTIIPEGDVDYLLPYSYETKGLENMSVAQSRKFIKEKLVEYGPLATAMDYKPALDDYTGGIFDPGNSKDGGGHWVVIVGWKDDASVKNGGYWIVKNSDVPNWGENGFCNIPYTVCNIDRYVIAYLLN